MRRAGGVAIEVSEKAYKALGIALLTQIRWNHASDGRAC
jgi:hypothetical protein